MHRNAARGIWVPTGPLSAVAAPAELYFPDVGGELPVLRSILVIATLLVASAPLRAEVIKIDVAGLEPLREKGVPVIDLRTSGEWSHTGVIEGSHLLTFGDAGGHYDVDGWALRLAAIAAREEPIALICWSGRRSSIASRILDREHGYEQVFDVVGGMERWIAAGRATVRP